MQKITKENTLDQIIEMIGCREREYMISPMEKMNYGFIPNEALRDQIKQIEQGRKFTQWSLEDVSKIFTAWKLQPMVDGMEYLVERAEKSTVFYDIWDGPGKENIKAVTGLVAFPVKDKTKFVIICPGGGYENVCSIAEGFPMAREINKLGYAAFILQYRTGVNLKCTDPLEDLAQAIRYILDHAEEFNVNTNGYAVLGFSAGGHLAASFGIKDLGYEKYGLKKPEMMILGYPVITMGEKTHEGSRSLLLGQDHMDDQDFRDQYSIEKQVDYSYPPTYLWQTEKDEAVPVENSRMMAEILKKNHVPYMYEVFPGQEHGWGLGTGTPAEGWIDHAVDFWKKIEG